MNRLILVSLMMAVVAVLVGGGGSVLAVDMGVDINDGMLLIDKTSHDETTTAANIRYWIWLGQNGGMWDGVNGIYSTWAKDINLNPPGPGNYGIGMGDTDIFGFPAGTMIGGQPVGPNGSIIVRFTYLGDANLDGAVDVGNDYNLWLEGLGNAENGQGSDWLRGDFIYNDYDITQPYNPTGIVDVGSDYNLWLAALDSEPLWNPFAAPPLPAPAGAVSSSQAVPEPGALMLLITAAGLFGMAFARRYNMRSR